MKGTMVDVVLTPQQKKIISKKVGNGRFHSANEVVHEALRLLDEQECQRSLRLEELRREIGLGIQAVDEGRSSLFDDIAIKRIKLKGRAMLAKRSSRSEV